MTVKSFGVGEGIILRKVLLLQFCAVLTHASGIFFPLFCNLFSSNDSNSPEYGICSCRV